MNETILKQVADLQGLAGWQLNERWRELFGTDPPAYSRTTLIKRLAYRLQELAFGGLSEPARERLREAIAGEELPPASGQPARRRRRRKKNGAPVTGTRLVREWQGESHEVIVVTDGFEYQGRRYRSLTAIAKVITGTQWNGPAFFGLRSANNGGGS